MEKVNMEKLINNYVKNKLADLVTCIQFIFFPSSSHKSDTCGK